MAKKEGAQVMAADASEPEWDVFVSYSRSDAQKITTLVPALRERGLRVFVDDTAVDDFASITATITDALARSKILLALYSADYPQRRACQWELTYAYLTGQREGDPRRRALVINPEPTADHVHPVELRDARHWPWPTTPQAVERLAGRVVAQVRHIATAMGDAAHAPFVPWLPAPARTGSVRFTDRLAEQWRVHTALHRHRAPLVAQAGGGRSAQLRGMPGIGKSLLAQEYALRFSSAFPGGIFWFDLHRGDPSAPADTMDAYAEQLRTVLSALGLDSSAVTISGLLSHLAVALAAHNAPCLWVVDGVPDGLSHEQLHLLQGPHLLTATLITTRSLRYAAFTECIDIAPLADTDGFRVLTSRREPRDELDHSAALALVRDVGGHPEALDLLADLAASSSFIDVRNRLHAHGSDILATRRLVAGNSTPDRPSPATALLPRPLSGRTPVDDVLRLLALACPTPLSRTALEDVLADAGPYDPWEVGSLVPDAVETLLGSGALRPDPLRDQSWTVHPLLARAALRHDADTARQEDLRRLLLHALTPAASTRSSSPGRSLTAAAITPPAPRPAVFTGTSPIERAAAFDLQVELVTRVGVQPLAEEHGSLREALTSLHSLFATTRDVLHRVATETATPLTLPSIAATLTNQHLRPFLATWHPALQEHEATRPADVSPVEHERHWKRAAEMRTELAELRAPLTSVAKDLAAVCGIDLLSTPAPPR
ncbi:TIR domain-containing protein [Streptomyces sp. NPDC007070]|uniref:TIR domain-containing protein n=1 Tax=Streptomyces sp. NPDC007070 TaxID=3154312 RepID=UPI0033FF666F